MLQLDLSNTLTPETAIRFIYFIKKYKPYQLHLVFSDKSFCNQLAIFSKNYDFMISNKKSKNHNICCDLTKL